MLSVTQIWEIVRGVDLQGIFPIKFLHFLVQISLGVARLLQTSVILINLRGTHIGESVISEDLLCVFTENSRILLRIFSISS